MQISESTLQLSKEWRQEIYFKFSIGTMKTEMKAEEPRVKSKGKMISFYFFSLSGFVFERVRLYRSI